MKRYKMIVAYDGTNYSGFARQPHAVTIQGLLEKALYQITKQEILTLGAGRTDKGVHARGQCVAFDLETKIPTFKLARALNSKLPPDIVVQSVEEVNNQFHPRFNAKRKTYRYSLLNTPVSNPFDYRYTLHYPYPIDIHKMQEAANYMIGEHDFKCFCAAGSTVKDTIRTIYSIELKREGPIVYMDICGNGFLYNMVRIIMGTLLYVNEDKISVSAIPKMILEKDRQKAGPTVPPQGLIMLHINYEAQINKENA